MRERARERVIKRKRESEKAKKNTARVSHSDAT